jgi:hypothetical protein
LLVVSVLLTSVVFAGTIPVGSFDSVFNWIERLRRGEDVRLEIRAGANAFSVYHEQTTKIGEGAFNQILQSSKGGPRLELTSESARLVYDVNDNLKVERQLARSPGAKTEAWFKRESIRVGSYPLGQWGGFVAAAMGHGLLEYDVTDEGKISVVTLGFKQMGPDEVPFGNKALLLSNEFYDHMKLSWNFKPVAGTDGFVIVVHDPHWSVSGALQLVPGLRALLGSNQQHQFIFLVEGEYGTSRDIGFNSLDRAVDSAAKSGRAEPLVYDMLSRFLIDSPTAYRLLYDRDLPAFAIDDAAYLETSSLGSHPEEGPKAFRAVQKLYDAASRVHWPATPDGKQAQKSIDEVIAVAVAYMTADVSDVQGQGLVDYYGTLASICDTLVKVGQGLKEMQRAVQIDSEISFLQGQAGAYQAERQTFENALHRNPTMVKYISQYAQARDGRIPIAFIGNFHTQGITEDLRKQSIGYVVVEPRFNSISSPTQLQDFDRILYEDQRKEYLKSLAGNRKLPVAPTVADVQDYYAPYLNRESVRVSERERISAQNFSRIRDTQIDVPSFNTALRDNGALTGALVDFDGGGGGGSPPPPGLGGAFAYFEPGKEGKGPRLIVLDPKDERWKDPSRYNYLREANLVLPFEGDRAHSRGKVTLYQDPTSKRMFAAFYDPSSKRFYFFEGEKAISALPIMMSLKPSNGREVLIHTRVAELLRGNQGGNDGG